MTGPKDAIEHNLETVAGPVVPSLTCRAAPPASRRRLVGAAGAIIVASVQSSSESPLSSIALRAAFLAATTFLGRPPRPASASDASSAWYWRAAWLIG